MEVEDTAERLHTLITKIQKVATSVLMPNKDTPAGITNNHKLSKLPLWQTLGRISTELGLNGDRELRDAFLALCSSVEDGVRAIPMRKESVRVMWLERVSSISQVFDADNFASLTTEVFARHFSSTNLETLDSISERFRSAGVQESTPEELSDALASVRDVIAALKSSGTLDERITNLLSHYLQQMETVYSQAQDFGDEIFWRVYKETFATFVQIHPAIAGLENAAEVRTKLSIVVSKLTSKSIAGVSLGANVATLATALYPVLVG